MISDIIFEKMVDLIYCHIQPITKKPQRILSYLLKYIPRLSSWSKKLPRPYVANIQSHTCSEPPHGGDANGGAGLRIDGLCLEDHHRT